MDVQQHIVERYLDSVERLGPIKEAIETARAAAIPVIYVRVAFRGGHPEVSPRNKTFSALSSRGGFAEEEAATQVHPAVAPQLGETTVVKKRVSAFTGSDLEVVLRSQQIESLVLTGIATSGVVLSTLREAADKDYRLVVLSDACIDGDSEVHRVLTEKVFPRQAEVMSAAEWRARTAPR